MTDADFKAMEDLATDMVFTEALKFIRRETESGLREAYERVLILGKNNPETVLGRSVAKLNRVFK